MIERYLFMLTGTLQGKVSLWDVGKQAVRVECENNNPSGVTRMIWAPGHNLICSTLSGTVKVFDGRSGQQKVLDKDILFETFKLNVGFLFPQTILSGHTSEIYEMSYNKSKSLLLTTSDDNTAKLFTSFIV